MKDTNSDFVDRFVKDTILKRRHPISNNVQPGDHLLNFVGEIIDRAQYYLLLRLR